MARLTDAQIRNVRSQSLRAVRRVQRKLDTRIEVMERRLDRAIENKEKITPIVANSIIDDYKKIVEICREVENALADMAIVFNATA